MKIVKKYIEPQTTIPVDLVRPGENQLEGKIQLKSHNSGTTNKVKIVKMFTDPQTDNNIPNNLVKLVQY